MPIEMGTTIRPDLHICCFETRVMRSATPYNEDVIADGLPGHD